MTYTSTPKYLSAILCLVASIPIYSQNLLINGGFEAFDQCPGQKTNFKDTVKYINAPTDSAPDYFNNCSGNDLGVPANFKGLEYAAEGEGYAGLYFYALNNYREYVQMSTAETLKEGYPYKIQLKVSLAETSDLALKNMSIVLTNKKFTLPNSSVLSFSRMDFIDGLEFYEVELTADKSMTEKDGWITLTGEFDAKGFETEIIIGNFNDNANTKLLQSGEKITSDYAYYFLDDVTLAALPKPNFEKEQIYVLQRNPYEPKGYKLDKKAIASVKKIFKYLKENAAVQMNITGHSDDSGTPEYNQFISSLRARAVAIYLKKMGIDEKRIVWEGKGSTQPLRNGKIKADNMANRRVEFVMTEFEDD